MKMINPSDIQLNEAFAEKIAGWMYWQSKHGHFHIIAPDGGELEPAYGWPEFDSSTGTKIERKWTDGLELPDYVGSADAVLPWLEKAGNGMVRFCPDVSGGSRWIVNIGDAHGACDSFAKASTIALLRSHGVEIEFAS